MEVKLKTALEALKHIESHVAPGHKTKTTWSHIYVEVARAIRDIEALMKLEARASR